MTRACLLQHPARLRSLVAFEITTGMYHFQPSQQLGKGITRPFIYLPIAARWKATVATYVVSVAPISQHLESVSENVGIQETL
jgi:hypothetical protein